MKLKASMTIICFLGIAIGFQNCSKFSAQNQNSSLPGMAGFTVSPDMIPDQSSGAVNQSGALAPADLTARAIPSTQPALTANFQGGYFGDPGGTVFPFFDFTAFAQNPIPANFATVKSIIGYYDENPAAVRAKLAAMRASGQKRIAFVLWFIGGSRTTGGSNFLHTVVPFPDGTLGAQHQANLKNFLLDVDSAGFTEVQVRFAPQGNSYYNQYSDDPCVGSTLSTPCIAGAAEFTWQFEQKAIEVIESAPLKNVSRLYDVAPEYPGHPSMATDSDYFNYTRYVWTAAVAAMNQTGIRTTMSFNAADPNGTEASFQLFDAVGYPKIFSIDTYDNSSQTLTTFANALSRHGHAGNPVFIQETYFNDLQSVAEFRQAIIKNNLNLQYVMQWPSARGSGGAADELDPGHYDNYERWSQNPVIFFPLVTASGLGCANKQCIYLQGNFFSSCQVSLYPGDWSGGGAMLATLSAGQLNCSPNSITFQIPDQLLPYASLNVVVTSTQGGWSLPTMVKLNH